eukprot:GFUD01109070.1.p1 GENE.GFUD01109070.1~~GFUD01109070.1.p1  ORF type:complete len:109 (+),score=27.33 GFUD01109070.1:41-328(+)
MALLLLSLCISTIFACNPSPSLNLNPLNAGGAGSVSMTCRGSSSSSCYGTLCTVTCSDGNKVELECENQLVSTNSEGYTVSVKCGTKAPACFPFC